MLAINSQNKPTNNSNNQQYRTSTFIHKLISILNNPANNYIIGWSKDGKRVTIWDIYEFTSTILPTYFKHKHYTSFARQLNMYGFRKLKQYLPIFMHDLFLRDDTFRLNYITRKQYRRSQLNKENKNNSYKIREYKIEYVNCVESDYCLHDVMLMWEENGKEIVEDGYRMLSIYCLSDEVEYNPVNQFHTKEWITYSHRMVFLGTMNYDLEDFGSVVLD